MILNAIAEKLKRQLKDDLKGRHCEAWLIVQTVTWYLRYPLSIRDLEELFLECGVKVEHSTINRWVLAYVRPTARATWITPVRENLNCSLHGEAPSRSNMIRRSQIEGDKTTWG